MLVCGYFQSLVVAAISLPCSTYVRNYSNTPCCLLYIIVHALRLCASVISLGSSIFATDLVFPLFFGPAFVLLHTVPVLYEKYEDEVDKFAEKAEAEIKKQYAVFEVKVLSKIPRGPLKEKKFL